jgi:hypothetical protein
MDGALWRVDRLEARASRASAPAVGGLVQKMPRLARWLLALVGTMVAAVMLYVGTIVGVIRYLQRVNLW